MLFTKSFTALYDYTLTDQQDSLRIFEALPGAVQENLTPEAVSAVQLMHKHTCTCIYVCNITEILYHYVQTVDTRYGQTAQRGGGQVWGKELESW